MHLSPGIHKKRGNKYGSGNRTLCIESLSPDTFVKPEQRVTITNMLISHKIRIAAIQETHIPHDLNYTLNGYKITTSDATNQTPEQTNQQTGLHIGGTEILIHEELAQRITSIVRTYRRIITVTLHSQKSHTPVTLINTYAPRKGLRKQENEHWKRVEQTLKEIPGDT